ncbi:MAG: MBL fold metallo-hydrolase [Betaproteobacteria bacterium]|nr:MBL fold metallo-hydrolase [Betaproteobacteria bacterium]
MRFAMLGSGSTGNGLVVECGATRLLLDCGFSVKETEARLQRLGLSLGQLDGIVVTHEHDDHVSGVRGLANRSGAPVFLTYGTLRELLGGDAPPATERYQLVDAGVPFAVGELEVHPFAVPHDAREPVQYVFSDGDARLGVLTDTGSSTPHIEASLAACDSLVLECNHDGPMLAGSRYPKWLKERIGGVFGHLSNVQAAGILAAIDRRRLSHVVAAHLSTSNNTPAAAQRALADVLACDPAWIAVADQQTGLTWRDVHAARVGG